MISPKAIAADESELPKILTVRQHRVVMDSDLAKLYSVPTKAWNQAVRRNRQRFPAEFCFQLTREDFAVLRSPFVTSSGRGGH
jgi:hypothetical protein